VENSLPAKFPAGISSNRFLLVDDVEREDAQAVELLLARSRAHAVKRAAVTTTTMNYNGTAGSIL
jgi:hypothetical protein